VAADLGPLSLGEDGYFCSMGVGSARRPGFGATKQDPGVTVGVGRFPSRVVIAGGARRARPPRRATDPRSPHRTRPPAATGDEARPTARRALGAARHAAAVPVADRRPSASRELPAPRLEAVARGGRRSVPADLRPALDVRVARARRGRLGVRARPDHGNVGADDRGALRRVAAGLGTGDQRQARRLRSARRRATRGERWLEG